jgi:predicted nucleic acid-binding protein
MNVVDTSVVVGALTLADESVRAECEKALRSSPAPIAHVFLETYSVLTRLPAPLRMTGMQAGTFLSQAFPKSPLAIGPDENRKLLDVLMHEHIIGGSTYDALIAFTSVKHSAQLITRDRRAAATYAAMGASITFI